MTLRPRAGHVLVRPIDGAAQALATALHIPTTARSLGYYVAEVLACGAGVDAVRTGDRVVVEAMSAPTGDIRDEGGRLAIVRCGPALQAQEREDEFICRDKAIKVLQRAHPDLKYRPPEVQEELRRHGMALDEIRESRRGRGRSRLLKPIRDLAEGEGIVAVIEDDEEVRFG